MKKERFWYPIINLRNHFLFGSYGKDVYIEPGVVINRPRYDVESKEWVKTDE